MSDAPEKILAWLKGNGGLIFAGGRVNDEIEYTRTDLIPAMLAKSRRDALEDAAEICDEERRNINFLTSSPPKSAAAVAARNRIRALIDKKEK